MIVFSNAIKLALASVLCFGHLCADSWTQLDYLVANAGSFSEYQGFGGDLRSKPYVQALPLKMLLAGLQPDKETFDPHISNYAPLTKLLPTSPLYNAAVTGMVTISTADVNLLNDLYISRSTDKNIGINTIQNVYGKSTCHIDFATLRDLYAKSFIVTDGKLVPGKFYKYLMRKEYIKKEQEKRSLEQVLSAEERQYILDNYAQLGFLSRVTAKQTLKFSVLHLACNVCHCQPIVSFVEGVKNAAGLALAKLCSGDCSVASGEHKLYLLSAPGISIRYGGQQVAASGKIVIDGKDHVRQLISNMWRVVLSASKRANLKALFFLNIGLGAFAGNFGDQVAPIYYEELAKLLKGPFKQSFNRVYFNALQYTGVLKQKITEHQVADVLKPCDQDIFYAALAAIQNDSPISALKVGVLNPSDADVIWGVYNVGEYALKGHFVAEEFFGALTTAVLGSKGINPKTYTERVFEAKREMGLHKPVHLHGHASPSCLNKQGSINSIPKFTGYNAVANDRVLTPQQYFKYAPGRQLMAAMRKHASSLKNDPLATVKLFGLDGQRERLSLRGLSYLLKSGKLFISENLFGEKSAAVVDELWKGSQPLASRLDASQAFTNIKDLSNWKKVRQHLKIDDIPPACLFNGVCHAQRVFNFIKYDAQGQMKMKCGKVDLRKKASSYWMLSSAGLPFSESAVKKLLSDDNKIKSLMRSMWQTMFAAAKHCKCKVVCLPAIGMGEFLVGLSSREAVRVKKLYMQTLRSVVVSYTAAGGRVYLCCNDKMYDSIKSEVDLLTTYTAGKFKRIDKDCNAIADWFAARKIIAAAVNPSHPLCIAGAVNLGNAYDSSAVNAAEENFARTTTLPLGSFSISRKAWLNPVWV